MAWTCATVRFTPQRAPISPQWRMNFCATGERCGICFCYFSHYRTYCRYGGLSSVFLACDRAGRRLARGGAQRGDQLGHFDADQRALPFPAGDLHAEVAAIEHTQALVDVADADTVRVNLRQAVLGDADAVVLDLNGQPPVLRGGADVNPADFDVQIVVNEVELRAQRHKRLMLAQQLAEDVAELDHHDASHVGVVADE